MQKIEYDSLYKFLVSLGIFILALPVVMIGLMYGKDPILISEEDYLKLSLFSIDELSFRGEIINYIRQYYFIFILICVVLGLFFIVFGINKWYSNQKEIDRDLKLKNAKSFQELSTFQKIQNVSEEIESEVSDDDMLVEVTLEENTEESTNDSRSEIRTRYVNDRVCKALEVESKVCEYLKFKYKESFDLYENIKVGNRYGFDAVAVSKEAEEDILFDIKYYNHPSANNIIRAIEHLNLMTELYEKEYSRHGKAQLIIVSDEAISERAKERVDYLINSLPSVNTEVCYMLLSELEA